MSPYALMPIALSMLAWNPNSRKPGSSVDHDVLIIKIKRINAILYFLLSYVVLNILCSLDRHITRIISECEILQNFSALSKRISFITLPRYFH